MRKLFGLAVCLALLAPAVSHAQKISAMTETNTPPTNVWVEVSVPTNAASTGNWFTKRINALALARTLTNSPAISNLIVTLVNNFAPSGPWTNNAGVIEPVSTNAIKIFPNGSIVVGGQTPGSATSRNLTFQNTNSYLLIGAGLDGGAFDATSTLYTDVSTDGYTTYDYFTLSLQTAEKVIEFGDEAGVVMLLKPTAADGTTPYVKKTSLPHTSGNLEEWSNTNFVVFAVAWNGVNQTNSAGTNIFNSYTIFSNIVQFITDVVIKGNVNITSNLVVNSITVTNLTVINPVNISTNITVQNIIVTNDISYRVVTNQPYADLTNFVVNFNQTYSKIFLTNDLKFSHSTNRDEGFWKSAVVDVHAGDANRSVWLTSTWTNLIGGSTTNIFTLPAGKTAIFSFACAGADEGHVKLVIATNAPGF